MPLFASPCERMKPPMLPRPARASRLGSQWRSDFGRPYCPPGCASAAQASSASSGRKCWLQGFPPTVVPHHSSLLVPGWPPGCIRVLPAQAPLLDSFSLFCWGGLPEACPLHPELLFSFWLITHPLSVYQCLPSTQATSSMRPGSTSSWFAAVYPGSQYKARNIAGVQKVFLKYY